MGQNPGSSVIKPGSGLNARTRKNDTRMRGPRAAEKAKKKQAANERKADREYEAYVKESRKRAVAIQTPEVQARMKANRKEADLRYKDKKKRVSGRSAKAGKKYR